MKPDDVKRDEQGKIERILQNARKLNYEILGKALAYRRAKRFRVNAEFAARALKGTAFNMVCNEEKIQICEDVLGAFWKTVEKQEGK